jgi:hypothetical protein
LGKEKPQALTCGKIGNQIGYIKQIIQQEARSTF